MNRRLIVLTLACAVAIGAATARADGPPQGIVSDGYGVASPDGTMRYISLSYGTQTLVEAIRIHGGVLANERLFRGLYWIPAIAWTADGLTRDGKTLVLTSSPSVPTGASFVVVRVPSLGIRRVVRLKGEWAFDAVSPSGRTL